MEYFFFALNLIKQRFFHVDSRNPGNIVERIEDAPKKAISLVQASTSQVSSGSVLPREKVELAFKLLRVSSRTLRILEYRSSSILILFIFAGSIGVGGCPSLGRYRAECSEREGEDTLVREGCSPREA